MFCQVYNCILSRYAETETCASRILEQIGEKGDVWEGKTAEMLAEHQYTVFLAAINMFLDFICWSGLTPSEPRKKE